MSAAGGFNAAALKVMLAKGLTLSDVAEIAEANEGRPTAAAVRQKRYRDNKRNVTRDVTPAPNDIDTLTPTQKISEPNGSSQKAVCFPADWVVPPVAELTPKAKACAEQWTSASYETEAEGFSLYWRQQRKRRPDWKATWCAWVIRQHSKIMRDQKFGNAPRDGPKTKTAQEWRELAEWYVRYGQPDRAEECRRKAIAIENRVSA